MEELRKFTDLQTDFSIYEKVGKRVNKIKFHIRPNHPKLATPQSFLEKTPLTPVADPLSSTEVYQSLLALGASMTQHALNIVKECQADEDYNSRVIDTLNRCKKHFAENPSIKNRGGFVLKAIQNDYYKTERVEEERQAELIAKRQYDKALEKEIATLVEEGRKEFEDRRAPKLQEIKAKYLTDEVAQEAISEYAPGELVYRKALDNFLTGKKSKLIQKRIDDYLANKYLETEYVNLDRFLAKNYSLEKVDGTYTLSV